MRTTKNSTRRDSGTHSDGQPAAAADATGCAHTPGPWALHQDGLAVFGAAPDRQQVVDCSVSSPNLTEEEQNANARLIAAAPELLAAARAGGRYCDALRPHQDAGESGTIIHDTGELERLFMDWHDKTHAAIAKVEGLL